MILKLFRVFTKEPLVSHDAGGSTVNIKSKYFERTLCDFFLFVFGLFGLFDLEKRLRASAVVAKSEVGVVAEAYELRDALRNPVP